MVRCNSGHIEYKDKRVINVTELPIPDIVDKFNARKAELVAKLAEEIAERQVVS